MNFLVTPDAPPGDRPTDGYEIIRGSRATLMPTEEDAFQDGKATYDGDGWITDPTRADTDRDGFKDDPDACAREGVALAAPSRSRSQQALSLGPLSC